MLTKFQELRLIARCVTLDDRRAFGSLVEAYQPRIRRFLLNVTGGDEALTDDLAQETFIKAYVGIRGFKGMASFGTWLYRIAYNEFYSHSRRRQESRMAESQSVVDAQLMVRDSSDRSAQATEAALTVRQAMKVLSDVERMVITMSVVEDLPIKQIAAITEMPEGTVKSHIHRAKQKMIQAIDFEATNGNK